MNSIWDFQAWGLCKCQFKLPQSKIQFETFCPACQKILVDSMANQNCKNELLVRAATNFHTEFSRSHTWQRDSNIHWLANNFRDVDYSRVTLDLNSFKDLDLANESIHSSRKRTSHITKSVLFPENLDVSTSSRENIEILGKQNRCFPREQSLSVLLYNQQSLCFECLWNLFL